VIEENMGAALSVDLRARVVSACRDEGMTYKEAACRFGVGYASVSRWMRLYRETNQLKAKPFPGRTPRIDEVGQALVRQLVETRPDATLLELAQAYGESRGTRLAPSIMHRALAKLGLTRKKRRSTRPSESAKTSRSCVGTSSSSAGVSDFGVDCFSSTKAG
jgi:transposase